MINNKKIKLVGILAILIILIIYILFIVFDNKSNKNNKNNNIVDNNIINNITQPSKNSGLDKYKNLGFEIVDNKTVFCNQNIDCIHDVFNDCINSIFLMPSKTDNVAYIITMTNFEDKCNLKVVNGSDQKDVKNCSIRGSDLNNEFIDSFFENKKYLEFCK